MSEPESPYRPFYVTGGTLKPGEPSYVERQADTELFESLLAGEFCHVLTARQMGKSSLMARTAKRLEQAGVHSAIVDLTQIGSERGNQAASQWYFGIANLVHRQLGINDPLRPWWQERDGLPPVQRLTEFFRDLVLTHCSGRIVVFVDEIDFTIGLPFADDFFAALRACFNARATEPAFERLTFVLLGVATPDQLIQDPTRTPFNVGKTIDLTDFSLEEAQTLAPGLHTDPSEAEGRLKRILYWTGGHPYLTQALCRAVRERGGNDGTAERAVDPQVEELFLTSRAQREETNLKHARARLEKSGPEKRRLLQLYRRVREGKLIPDQPTAPLFAQIKLTGVIKANNEGLLAVRNRIYESVFTQEWANSAMPVDRGRQITTTFLAATLASTLVWYAAFQPRPYEEAFRGAIQADAYNVAFNAYTHLRANPFSRSRATELMQSFWEQRALRYALAGKRDESALSYLQGLNLKEAQGLRRRAQNLIYPDYERLRFTLRHSDNVTALTFSHDGRVLATGSNDKTAQLWDTRTGRPIGSPLQHQGVVRAINFSADDQILTTGSDDGTAHLWNIVTGKPLNLQNHASGNQRRALAVALSPDGRTMATGSNILTTKSGPVLEKSSENLQFWESSTGKPIKTLLKAQEYIDTVAFSPNGKLIAAGSRASSSIQLYDFRTTDAHPQYLKLFLFVGVLAFSPDNSMLAAASYDTIRVYDVHDGTIIRVFRPLPGLTSLAFSPDGRTLAVGSSTGIAYLVDIRTGNTITPILRPAVAIRVMAFSPDGQTLAMSCEDKTTRIWDISARKVLPPQKQFPIEEVAFNSDGRAIIAGHKDNYVFLRDLHSEKDITPPLRQEIPFATRPFSPDGKLLAVVYQNNSVRLWDTTNGKPLTTYLQHSATINSMVISPDDRILATASQDGIRIWSLSKERLLLPVLRQEDKLPIMLFSPNSKILAISSLTGVVRLLDVMTGKTLTSFEHKDILTSLAFSPDGQVLATAEYSLDSDSTIQFWNTLTGKPLNDPISVQSYSVASCFSPDGNIFVSLSSLGWLNSYKWENKKAKIQGSQLSLGFEAQLRFPPDCKHCVQAILMDKINSARTEIFHLDEPADPPIEGDPKNLLRKWQNRLGLKFNDQMKPVPALEFSENSGGGALR